MRKRYQLKHGWLAAIWFWLGGALALAQVPGAPLPSGSETSAQKPGSVLVYNLFTSATATPNAQETEISITNTNATTAVGVRLFFINGANGAVSNQAVQLAPNQTTSIFASQAAPNITGYAVAVAIDINTGCPVSFNFLRGSAFIKFNPTAGFVAKLPAEAFAALYTGALASCSAGAPSATLDFDGASYNRLPRVVAADNIPSRADSNSGLLVINRMRGNLLTGLSPLGILSGALFDDAENSFTYTAAVGSSQLRGSLSNSFPNTTPPFELAIPFGRSGWLTMFAANGSGLLGAVINFNFGPNPAADPSAFNHGRNLRILTLNSANDSLIVPVIPINPGDPTLAKSAAPNPVAVGQELTFNLNVTNNGPGAALGVAVTDVLPSSVNFVSATAAQGSCLTPPVGSSGTVTCSVGTLAGGQSAAISIVVRPTTIGTLSNTATVSSTSVDSNPGNNTATVSVTVSTSDPALAKTATPNPVTAGQQLTYNLNVTNNGPGVALGVTVTDVLPDSVTFVSATAAQGSCSTPPVGSSGTVTCAVGTLTSGQSVAIAIAVRPTVAGVLNNTASVSATSADSNPGNNTATASVTVIAVPQLQIAIEGGLEFGPVPAGRASNPNPPSRTITVSNPGSGALDLNFASMLRTGADVASGKIADADDRRLFLLRSIAASGIETPVNIGAPMTIAPGQQQRFRILFDPIIPALAGRTINLSANQVLPETITSRITINNNAGAPATLDLIGRLTTPLRLIHPIDPQLGPLVTFARSGDDLIVECSVYDPNMDVNMIRYQFLDQSERPVLAPSDFDLRPQVQQSGLARGQSFGVVQRFPGAVRRGEIRRVRITVFDPGANDAATSAELSAAGALANVSAASFSPAGLAAEGITAAYGLELATSTMAASSAPLPTTLGGTRVVVRDSRNVDRDAPIFFVSPGQVNYLMPAGTAAGAATARITSGNGKVSTGNISVATVAPGMFAANANGQGVASGVVLRVRGDGAQTFEPLAQFDPAVGRFVARPIDLGPATDQVFLVLFATGIRHHGSPNAVRARIGGPGGADAPVLFAGAQGGFVGLDQINLQLPRGLAGRGEVDVAVTIDGRAANLVRISVGGAAQTIANEASPRAAFNQPSQPEPRLTSSFTRLAPVITLPPRSLFAEEAGANGRGRKGEKQ